MFLVSGLGAARPIAPPEAVFYPPLPDQPRLQFLKSFSKTEDVGDGGGSFKRFVFGARDDESGLGKPYGLAAHGGRLYVCDMTAGDVKILDWAKKTVSSLAAPRRLRLSKPVNITIAPDGTKFVADSGLGRVVAFGPDDSYLKSYTDPTGWTPTDVAVTANALFVVDIANHRIKKVDRASGAVSLFAGGAGSGPGQLFKPTNIAVDGDGNIYVADTINFRIQKFSPDGALIGGFGQLGQEPGDFSRPKGLALDGSGLIYVVDAAFDNVQIFNTEGRVLTFFGGSGNGPGELFLPAKVAIDRDPADIARFKSLADPRFTVEYLVWVTNQYGPRKINLYGFGQWKETAP